MLIAILAMPEITKYKVDVAEKRYLRGSQRMIYYSDLDGDQVDEEINVDHNPDFLKLMIMQGKGLVDQYNLSSKAAGSEYLYVEDYDLDGYNEIFILSTRDNSLLLSILDPMNIFSAEKGLDRL